ncbi:FAD-dependent monooxygenase [Flaviflagellibacter deserti]|uniref:FAD-dependent monooxygenase n=1 Tax=Flaviflagellibacter deserti TaxID=2267266 RepID=A0ABV9Z202_9HYPH
MPPQRPILIAGAGIGGLTLALALARHGMSAAIIERAPALEEIGAGIQITPNAGRILDELGLGQALDTAGLRPDAIRLIDGRTGRAITHMPLGDAAENRWGAPYRLIHRARLQSVLANAVASAGVEIRLATELIDVAQTEDRVIVHVRNTRGDETVATPALIGADGLRSTVRARLGRPTPVFSGQVAWRAVAAVRTGNEAAVWLGPEAHLVTYPVEQRGTLNLVATAQGTSPDRGWGTPASTQEAGAAFSAWTPTIRQLIASAGPWLKWPLYELPQLSSWSEGRITLLGDAAHAALPHMAQGAAMAIEDAAVLANQLVRWPAEPKQAFTAYEKLRKPRVTAVQRTSRQNGQIYRMGGLMALARDTALRAMGPNRLMSRFDWVYGYRPDS